ncbi:hypothetical protein [Geomicrobium sp. JCM 19039]|uniref:hypothetical protein n=1 Tax=Geomicrobium sp. JCM 19039 TaxID=1460636 RepID=UPI0012695451|nr:hypothetical protein [Geomicrobium sp. JCM 19039]
MRRSEWLPVMLATAIIACVAVALDLLLSPSLTWSPFLLLLLLLWPLSHLPYRTYSITGSTLIFITLALINSIETPHYAWFCSRCRYSYGHFPLGFHVHLKNRSWLGPVSLSFRSITSGSTSGGRTASRGQSFPYLRYSGGR